MTGLSFECQVTDEELVESVQFVSLEVLLTRKHSPAIVPEEHSGYCSAQQTARHWVSLSMAALVLYPNLVPVQPPMINRNRVSLWTVPFLCLSTMFARSVTCHCAFSMLA